eukprot:2709455-Amphidinium_carterae.1
MSQIGILDIDEAREQLTLGPTAQQPSTASKSKAHPPYTAGHLLAVFWGLWEESSSFSCAQDFPSNTQYSCFHKHFTTEATAHPDTMRTDETPVLHKPGTSTSRNYVKYVF